MQETSIDALAENIASRLSNLPDNGAVLARVHIRYCGACCCVVLLVPCAFRVEGVWWNIRSDAVPLQVRLGQTEHWMNALLLGNLRDQLSHTIHCVATHLNWSMPSGMLPMVTADLEILPCLITAENYSAITFEAVAMPVAA